MKKFLRILMGLMIVTVSASNVSSMTIGYYDTSREDWGFDGNNYLSEAKQYLIDQGHTLVTTNYVDDAFLGGVDAFYTGLISSIDAAEISAMQNFVDVNGGFLFIQTDWAVGTWTGSANDILANWGISVSGSYSNDGGHYTVGTSDWVTSPNDVDNFIGAAHSVITSSESGFEVLAYDDADRAIMGVYDAGAGRSSDVLIATDINFWDDGIGWQNESNRQLWENIWQAVDTQVGGGDSDPVPEPGTMLLLGAGLLGFAVKRHKKK